MYEQDGNFLLWAMNEGLQRGNNNAMNVDPPFTLQG